MDETPYEETTSWTIRVEAAAQFAETYQGDDDGYVWRERFHKEIQPMIAAAVFRALATLEGWKVRTANRGLPATDELLIKIERRYE